MCATYGTSYQVFASPRTPKLLKHERTVRAVPLELQFLFFREVYMASKRRIFADLWL